MSDSNTTEAERDAQSKFSLAEFTAILLLLAAIGLFDRLMLFVPNRHELGTRTAELRFVAAELDPRGFGPFRLTGAWQVSSGDVRFGGISALVMDRGNLVALTDSGVLIRFGVPRGPVGQAGIRELPEGPGSGRFKRNRDSEALVRDPQGRGWWVAFENHHEIWLYEQGFERALERIELGSGRWRANKGIEAAVPDGGGLLLLPEAGNQALPLSGARAREMPIGKARGRIADAAAIAPGRFIAVERRLTPLGFSNALVRLDRLKNGYRFGRRIALPLRPIDNVEAIAVEHWRNGRMRVWLMTDDNFQRPLRTLLIALDMPAETDTPGG